MAKIIYFPSPIDESKSREIISKFTLKYAMKELGIENEPVQVTINGMTPDDIDVETFLDDTDIVEIRRGVHGGGDAETKRTLATVVQVAALVVASFYTGGAAAGILLAGAVASGALNKWANDILAGQNRGQDEQEISVQSNSYSERTAANKARVLSPLPVPIGSHRYAPDVHTDFYRTRYAWQGTSGFADPFQSSFNPAYISSNGPMAPNNSWATMPANFMAPGLPPYPIKVAPYGIIEKTTALTPAENSIIINEVASAWGTPAFSNFNAYRVGYNITTSYPIYIYHFDPADPFRGRFNLIWTIQRMYEAFGSFSVSVWYNGWMSSVFNSTVPSYSVPADAYKLFWFNSALGLANSLLRATGTSTNTLPPGVSTTNVGQAYVDYGNYLRALNGGSYSTTDKTTSPDGVIFLYDYAMQQTNEGVPIATQSFNFGVGDLEITDRTVGSVDVVTQYGATVGYEPNDKTHPFINEKWKVQDITAPNIGAVNFKLEIQNIPTKSLINPDVYNGLIPITDQGTYNWNYFKGKAGYDRFRFTINGRLYATSPSGFLTNITRMQIHYRWKNVNTGLEGPWYNFIFPVSTISNANTQEIYLSFELNQGTMYLTPISTQYLSLEVRVRKVNLDSSDNAGDKVSELSIKDACFFPSVPSISERGENFKNAPFNIEGLYTTGLITDTATTNQFSGLVEAKCWVYDFDAETWSWTKTRNPAWWFLYFARGGFLNLESDGTYPTPYSPTIGWVNYPGHPDSTDHIFGGGYPDEEIDMDKIMEWGFFCEDRSLYVDMIIRDDTSVADILERIANIGRASVSYYSGKLSVVIEDPDQVPVCLFGMANIMAKSFSVDYAVSDPIKKVVATYTNRDTWESDTVESIVPFSDDDLIKELQITIDGVTDPENALREANILAARQFYQRRTYSWKTDMEGYLAGRGDLVYLSHDSTQYGFSGRLIEFVVAEGIVLGFKTGSFIDDGVTYVSVRTPDNEIETYECHFEDGVIFFDTEYPIEKASFYLNNMEENALSDFPESIADDFIFIADFKQTTGKRVRISQVEASDDGTFTITAVDEDPAMWAYEFNEDIPGTSFSDSEIVVSVQSLGFKDLGDGRIKLIWELDGAEAVQVINLNTNLPVEANGQYSFTGGEVTLELLQGIQYELEVKPLAFGTPYKSVSQKVKVWPL